MPPIGDAQGQRMRDENIKVGFLNELFGADELRDVYVYWAVRENPADVHKERYTRDVAVRQVTSIELDRGEVGDHTWSAGCRRSRKCV